jgi:non-lysosomal glucosylceramidase
MNKRRYSTTELYCGNSQKIYKGDAKEAGFLLGGIGTGNISVGARGELKSWQIFNEPGQFNYMPYTFFAIRAETEGEEPVARVLESQIEPPYAKSQGFLRGELAGLPRFAKSSMLVRYPFVQIDFEDEEIPLIVSMEAYTPFIPLNADDSGIPGAYITYKVRNPLQKPVKVSVAGTLDNPVGFEKYDNFSLVKRAGKCKNEYRNESGLKGIFFYGEDIPENHIANGSMSLITANEYVTPKPVWFQGEWTDGAEDFWEDFAADGRLEETSEKELIGCKWAESGTDYRFLHFTDSIGSLCIEETLKAEEEKEFTFILTWYFPNRVRAWGDLDQHKKAVAEGRYDIIRNYYAQSYADAWSVGEYLHRESKRLYLQSRKFTDAFYGTTLPGYVLEAVADNITVLRSPTCFRIENGDFLGWEGVENELGCGAGNCTHVWNYAQTVAYLFPELEQTMRKIEFVLEIQEDGYMPFRAYQPLGLPKWEMAPAADGQLGAVVRLYREWKISGNDELLNACWDGVKLTMAYVKKVWDLDGDGVLEQPQHVTYDTELYGITSMVSSIYYAALKAAAEMACYLGESDLAGEFEDTLKRGSEKMDCISYNGEYYEQIVDDVDNYRYQYGKGCLSDQLLGQFMAFTAGLDYILPEEHVKKAVGAIYKYNFVDNAKNNVHLERAYILNDEKGLTPCTWPKGGRPRFPFVYYGEVWTGIEYEVASLLLYNDMIDEGLTLVKTVRDRQDGYKRNPWSENESGYYYTRAMSSYGVLLALTGYKCDMVKGRMSFSPKINKKDFKTFWCNGKAWGIYSQKEDPETGELKKEIRTLYGDPGEMTYSKELDVFIGK